MKRSLVAIIFFATILILVFTGVFWWKTNSSPVSKDVVSERVVIPKGKGATQVGIILQEKGLIKSSLAFKIYVQVMGLSEKIQAGEFELSKNLTLEETVNKLLSGPLELWVTIPEGLRSEEVVEKIVAGLEMEAERAKVFRSEFLLKAKGEEGFLFPNTYLFPRDVTAEAAVLRLTGLFNSQTKKFDNQFTGGKTKEGLTMSKVVTLASIIEREAITDEERPVIAGIYFNRLDIGMALQADAAVQYAVASAKCKAKSTNCENWWPILTGEDLLIDSPYNTYKYPGLPPAPIANPGISSIEAVFKPEKSDYLYYIHDQNGQIHYAETLDEHNQNVRNYLQ